MMDYQEKIIEEFELLHRMSVERAKSAPVWGAALNRRELSDWLRKSLQQAHSAGVEEGRTAGAREERERTLKVIERLKISADSADLEGIADIYRNFWREIKTKLLTNLQPVHEEEVFHQGGSGVEIKTNDIDWSEGSHTPKSGECCDKCYSTYTEKDWPAHTTHDACINQVCPCHQPQ